METQNVKPYDLSIVIPAAYAAAVPSATAGKDGKGFDIMAAIAWALSNQATIQAVVATLKGLFKRDAAPATGAPSVPGVVEDLPDEPVPAKPNAPTPGNQPRKIAGLRISYLLINRKKSMKPNSGRYILPKAEFDRVVSGSDPLQAGDNAHVDITPVDQFGVPFYKGDAANELLLDANRLPRFVYKVHGVAEIQSIADPGDPYGCTPVLHVPWGEGSEVKPGFEGVIGLSVTLPAEGLTAELPDLRVKPWGA